MGTAQRNAALNKPKHTLPDSGATTSSYQEEESSSAVRISIVRLLTNGHQFGGHTPDRYSTNSVLGDNGIEVVFSPRDAQNRPVATEGNRGDGGRRPGDFWSRRASRPLGFFARRSESPLPQHVVRQSLPLRPALAARCAAARTIETVRASYDSRRPTPRSRADDPRSAGIDHAPGRRFELRGFAGPAERDQRLGSFTDSTGIELDNKRDTDMGQQYEPDMSRFAPDGAANRNAITVGGTQRRGVETVSLRLDLGHASRSRSDLTSSLVPHPHPIPTSFQTSQSNRPFANCSPIRCRTN